VIVEVRSPSVAEHIHGDYALVSFLSSPLLKLYGYPILRGGVDL
jgi:hypothetical protein